MIFRCSVTILLNGSSMTTAPVVSKRPCRTTLVMPPGRSSAKMSMQHLSVGPSAPAGCHSRIRFAAEWRNHSRSEDFRTIHIPPLPFRQWRRIIAGSRLSPAVQYRWRENAERARSAGARVPFDVDRNSAVTDNRPMGAGPRILVLLDVMMPKVDGFQVLAWLKDQARLRDLPVIMISALTEMNSMARCIELGAVDYLLKPFNPILLKARLGATLEKKRLRDEIDAHLARLQEELDAARRLQMAMVPQSFPAPSP